MRWFMIGVVVLAALLGVAPGCESVKTKFGLLKDWVKDRVSTATNDPVRAEIKAVEAARGKEILVSVSNAADIFSIRVGGGGDNRFPTNAFQMSENMPPVVARCVTGCFNAPVVPFGGYVCEYRVDPSRTNYLCKAFPAEGYTGSVFVVQKDKVIRRVGEKTLTPTNDVPMKN